MLFVPQVVPLAALVEEDASTLRGGSEPFLSLADQVFRSGTADELGCVPRNCAAR
jgi:hypothetical protein